jgi:DNA-binding NtrC family response regulator
MSQDLPKILLADDSTMFRSNVVTARPLRDTYDFDQASNLQQLWELLEENNYDLLLLKQIGVIVEKHPRLPIVVVTNEGDVSVVVKAMKQGACNYLHKAGVDYDLWNYTFKKEIDNNKLKHRAAEVERENEELVKQIQTYKNKESARYPFIGNTTGIQEIKRTLEHVADSPQTNVLILGETGTGKEVAARYLHSFSPRCEKEFVGVNLSAIQKTLLESQLFGSRKGGYTGAVRDLRGYFEQANGGILMLDEIGDIDQAIQIKLLRFLETRLIRPVGSDEDIELDLQIIAATHRDLRKEIAEERFREDLYQRLKVMKIEIPPLRKRPEDIPLLLDHFLERSGLSHADIDKEAFDKLMSYSWYGNIRELKNTVESMLIKKNINKISTIALECLPEEIRDYDPQEQLSEPGLPSNGLSRELSADEQKGLIDLRKIEEALRVKNGKKGDAAKYWNGKDADAMSYRVKTVYKKYPDLFTEEFYKIAECYPNVVKRNK